MDTTAEATTYLQMTRLPSPVFRDITEQRATIDDLPISDIDAAGPFKKVSHFVDIVHGMPEFFDRQGLVRAVA